MHMKLTYETGVATLVQFVLISFLNILTAIGSTAHACTKDSNDCVSTLILSLLYYLLLVGWFGAVWLLGVAAQTRRSRRLAQLLIATEALIAFVALFNARHVHDDPLGKFVSIVGLVVALWVIVLAFRLMRAKGGRVVTRQRPRQRQRSTSHHNE